MEGMGNMNTGDRSLDLLSAIKPFLKKSRQESVDKAVSIISTMRMLKMFKNFG